MSAFSIWRCSGPHGRVKPPVSPSPIVHAERLRSCDESTPTSYAWLASVQLKRHSAISLLPNGLAGRLQSSCDRRPTSFAAAAHGCCFHSAYPELIEPHQRA